jgi:hypothetical protein
MRPKLPAGAIRRMAVIKKFSYKRGICFDSAQTNNCTKVNEKESKKRQYGEQ